jgi:hypothetical protein
VVQRSISDAAFRSKLATDSTGALRGYDLTPDELGAIRSRDAAKLTAFGVDVRMSKVFTLDPGLSGTAAETAGEPRDLAPVWIGDGGTTVQPGASPMFIGDGFDNTTEANTGTDGGLDDSAALTANEPRDSAPTWIGENVVGSDGYATDEGQITGAFQAPTEPTVGGDGDLQQ